MENLLQIASVPVVTVIVYGVMALYKHAVNGKESLVRLIPVLSVTLGAVLGIAAFYALPGVVIADNILAAILIGGASGLAATGTNQAFKQLYKTDKEDEGNADTEDENHQ